LITQAVVYPDAEAVARGLCIMALKKQGICKEWKMERKRRQEKAGNGKCNEILLLLPCHFPL